MQDISEVSKKAGVLIEAISYIKRFKGSVFVVKYGGAFMDDPDPKIRASVPTTSRFSRRSAYGRWLSTAADLRSARC